jgi:DNA-binding GntR family transcriptional regulator
MAGDRAVPVNSWQTSAPLPRRQNLADGVYEALKELIMDGAIANDSRVNLDEAARQLGVSQSPLREALVRLEAVGLVTKEPFRGYSTTPLLSREELLDLFEFRFVVEPWAAARAAERITPEGVAALKAELASCPKAPTGQYYQSYRGLSAHDARLHDLVQALSGNDHMRRALDRTHCHLHILRLRYRGGMGTAALREHRQLVSAITSGDPEAADKAMRAHLTASRDRLLPVYDEPRPD